VTGAVDVLSTAPERGGWVSKKNENLVEIRFPFPRRRLPANSTSLNPQSLSLPVLGESVLAEFRSSFPALRFSSKHKGLARSHTVQVGS
jgi:hypothetical protein